jgi:threonylcarbamoyladenosine tRNA methylthiotransferase MtaB
MTKSGKAMRKVAITTLGCKTNQFESAAMRESLLTEGYEIVAFSHSADIYVINTCTVTARTDAESRKLVRRAARLNPGSKIVVTGCYAQLAAKELADLPNVALVAGNNEKRGIAELVRDLDGEPRIIVSDIGAAHKSKGLHLETFSEHTRSFLQIQNGCDSFCSYCIVPYARGRSRSVPFEEVLEGVRRSVKAGFAEVVLTGIHLGAYGLDLRPRRGLLELVQGIDAGGLVTRLRLGSIEPNEVTDEFIGFMATSRTVCPHLHLPLQSGSAAVLSAMGRGYEPGFIRQLVSKLVSGLPDISIGLDLIAGFPGESEENHAETCRLIEELPVSYLHVFPYSSRPGTKAAAMPGHLDPSVIKGRAEELRSIGERKRLEFAGRFVGRVLPTLIQGGGKSGLTRNYLNVNLDGEANPEAVELPVMIRGVMPDGSCTGSLSITP